MSWSPEEFAEVTSAFRREFAGAFRRMLVTRTGTGTWQTMGHALLDPTKPETREIENWPGIGVTARPPDGGSGEAVVVQIGGPNNPAIVATRDEATRTLVDDIAPNESTLYNSLSRVYVRNDGTIELRSHTPTTVEPALKGNTYTSAENTFLAAFVTWLGSLTTALPSMTTPNATLATAIGVFQTALTASKSAVVKVG